VISPSLRIHLFGQPRFVFEGAPFRYSAPPKATSLVAYLLLHRDAPLSREKLAFTLWEDDTEEDARANLRRHLHHMQRALPVAPPDAPWVLADAETMQWNPGANAWLDVAEFERLTRTPDGRAAAIELYTGDLVESLYDEWLFTERDRLRNMYLAALGELLIECRGQRDFSRAIAYAQRILTNDPWREDTLRQLITVRYQSGDRAGALAAYEAFDRRLRDEMNVEPMPETAALRDVILRNAPLPDAAAAPLADIVGGQKSSSDVLLPFVGRTDEMEQLRMLWSRAARGRGSVVLFGGEAGIGKTRLATEFALVAGAQGARVMSGGTTYPEAAPYQSIAESLRSVAPLLMSLKVEPVWLGVVAHAVPELRARRPDLPAPPKVEPERERIRLFEAFAKCFEELARPRPVLIILEDLHWAGEGTIGALAFLARRLAQMPILIIATYRDEEAPRAHPLRRARAELQEAKILSTLSPRGLDRDAVLELTRQIPSIAGRGSEFAGALVERSAGNPLFLSEVIRGLVEHPDLDESDPPASARQAIEARIARLSEPARALVGIAAVVGQGFNIDLVRDVAGWNENDVLDALNELIDRHVVKEAGGRTGYAYAFTHHLIQSTIYATIPSDVRMRGHRHVARMLEELYEHRAGQFASDIANHHDLGNDPERAARAYLVAARQALDVYAHDEALGDLGRCLELAQDAAIRVEALSLREGIRARRGERDGQRADLAELTELAAAADDATLRCDIARRKVMLARALGEHEEEMRLVDEFGELAAAADSPALRAQAFLARAAFRTPTGGSEEASDAARAALAIYRELGDATGQIEARCRIVDIASERGAFDEASAILREARISPEAPRNPRMIARTIISVTQAALYEQQYAACRSLAIEARDLYRTIGDREGEADAISRQATAAARLSLLAEARSCFEDAAAIYGAIGKRQGLAGVLVNGGIHCVRVGLLDEADRSLRASLEVFSTLKDLRGQAASAINLSYVRLFRGDPGEAKIYAAAGLEHARAAGHALYEAAALGNLGAAERDLGDFEAAISHMKEGLAARRRLNRPGDYADDIAHLVAAYLASGDNDAVRAMSDEFAESLASSAPAIFLPQFAHWIAARAFRELGDRTKMRLMLERAHEIVREQIDSIEGAAAKSSYASLTVNRAIESAFAKDSWPPSARVGSEVGTDGELSGAAPSGAARLSPARKRRVRK
jgi:DNA-binding SARP family transcriptional activator/tetratricopeptide (TPR) repeat protein